MLLRALRAVGRGDFGVRLPTDGSGVAPDIAEAFNEIVELNERTSRELRRISRVVGREGHLGERAAIGPANGEWARNIDSINRLVADLTDQTREASRVLGAVARGDLSQRMSLEIEGRPLKGAYRRAGETINTMVDQLNAFASEVTRVAREVGTEGKLGGQADVRGVGGTWKDLTDSVNSMAGNLTAQVRAIGDVATAVTRGDLSRAIQVEAQGELAVLKDDLNEMIRNLRDTTQKNEEQDWLKSNVARFNQLLQGQRDMQTVARLTLSELSSLVGIHRGVFYVYDADGDQPALRLLAGYGHEPARGPAATFRLGEGLVGQCALERRRILLDPVPAGYMAINSALGTAAPASVVVLPITFETETRAVMELASLDRLTEIQLLFLDQLTESVGIVLNSIAANIRAGQLVQEQAARAELEAGLARLRQVVDVMPEGILIADAAGRVYLSNAAAEDIMGVVPPTVLAEGSGLPSISRLDGSYCPPDQQPLSRAVFGREVVRGDQLVVTNAVTGREVPILVNSAPLSDAQGIPAGGVAVFQDITPLRDVDRQKDEFLAAISHDLKTPATIIKGRANLLQRAVQRAAREGSEELAEGLQAIDESTAQLVRLVDQLLDLTRVRMGQPVQLELRPTDLVGIVERLAAEYQAISPRHTIRVESGVPRLLGDWDHARIERVVANLISNAVKYSPRGGEISVRVWSVEEPDEEWAVLVVEDHGIGIPPSELERIFEPYYRGTNVGASISGSGIGLAGTLHIVEQHGGRITVESSEGEATTVTVRLPLIREEAELARA
ncbi:MAG TPA: ATP-binding protein [Candidatus Limnocylindrales bacterium]|nr:ATP-binding protein [Candidatus Limnocylindrales bacterium]